MKGLLQAKCLTLGNYRLDEWPLLLASDDAIGAAHHACRASLLRKAAHKEPANMLRCLTAAIAILCSFVVSVSAAKSQFFENLSPAQFKHRDQLNFMHLSDEAGSNNTCGRVALVSDHDHP